MVREKPRPRFGFSDNIRYTAASLPLTGEINLAEAEKEVGRLAELTQAMFRGFNEVYENPETDLQERVTALKAMEEESDKMAFAITQYLIFCASSEISQERANTVVVLLRVVSELEEICDLCYALVKLAEKRSRRQHVLPASTQREVRSFGRLVDEFMEFYQRNLSRRVTPADLEIAMDMENTIDRSRKALRREALNRMTDPDNIKSEILYIDILNNIEKIGNHSLNILQLLCAKD
nr:PhoU domain-containing protein [Oscillatoria laete-virens]